MSDDICRAETHSSSENSLEGRYSVQMVDVDPGERHTFVTLRMTGVVPMKGLEAGFLAGEDGGEILAHSFQVLEKQTLGTEVSLIVTLETPGGEERGCPRGGEVVDNEDVREAINRALKTGGLALLYAVSRTFWFRSGINRVLYHILLKPFVSFGGYARKAETS